MHAGPTSAPRDRRLAGFVARVFGWLVPAFVLGYFAAPVLLWPASLLVKLAAAAGFADLVRGTAQSATTFAFITTLRPGDSMSQAGRIVIEIDMLRYAFGLPLYAALTLAARESRWPRRLIVGYAALVPFVAWGVLADFLRNVAITAGPLVASQTGFVAWQREAIAFAFQLGSLILPTVAPAVAWVLLHRTFIESLEVGPRRVEPG